MASKALPGGDVVEESVGGGVVVHAAAVVLHAVRHYEVVDVHGVVVAADLLKHALSDFHVWALIFHYHERTQAAVVYHSIASTRHACHADTHFVDHQREGVSFVMMQKRHKVLPHPFLGGEGHEGVAQGVEDAHAAVLGASAQVGWRQIECW